MTWPAAAAIASGTFDSWRSGYIPASADVCMHVCHEARVAAWNDRLFSFDLHHMVDPFLGVVHRFGGHERLLEYLEVKYSARRIRRHAESLMMQIEDAEFVPSSRIQWLAHPITGEVAPPGKVDRGDVPFAFAGIEAMWRGVDASELSDYAKDCNGDPDVMEYLAASFSAPDALLNNIEELDAAVHALLRTDDRSFFQKWVREWNSKQDVRMTFKDERRAIGLGGLTDKREALNWCRRYLDSAIELESAIDESYSSRIL